MYTPLFIETHHSMRGSNITVKNLLNKAISYGYRSLAIADTSLYGVFKFYHACKEKNIKPIIGLQCKLEGLKEDTTTNVVLYAKNDKGYHHLLRLASISSIKGIISLSEYKQNKEGIILVYLSDQSELYQYHKNNQQNETKEIMSMLSSHTETWYISYVDDVDFINDIGEDKIVLMDYAKYLEKDDKETSNVLEMIFNNSQQGMLQTELSHHLKDQDEIKRLYNHITAIENTSAIATMCNVTIKQHQTLLPKYPVKDNVSSKQYLRALVLKGLDKRLKNQQVNKKEYKDRVEYELKIIDQMGYNDYFLIVWDFVKYAKSKKYLVGPGRGSAAASLVSYCLGITSVDSIKYDLVFERFLNPERITMPDIDIDLPDDKRDDVISYVRDLYGINHVASICTFGTFLSKSAIRDTARVLDLSGVIISEIIKAIENYKTIDEAINSSDAIQNIMNKNQLANQVIQVASKIEGLQRHVSTHAAGIIVSNDDLTKHTALQQGLLDMMQTQYEAKDLEDIGLLKIDFLGLRNLTSIDNIASLIEQNEKKKIDVYKIPLDDKKTFDLLKRVETTGIFQLESNGMRSLIRQMQIDNFEDIVTILALFRPGPMENIPSYIKRRFKEETITYPDPVIKEILEPTNGIIIYQEQINKIASVFAGYSMGEADVLRRAVSKKQAAVLNQERTRFMKKAKQMKRDEKRSANIYDYIVKFANYGFNRAHSVAYAMVSYWMAYLKANYPSYFISVLTTSVIGSETQTKNYIYEANKLGIHVVKPSVNKSTLIFEPIEDALVYPFPGVKNVGYNTANSLLAERDNGLFNSYVEFVSRCHKVVNKRVIESLIYAGALDEFGHTRKTMIDQLEEVINFTEYGSLIDDNQFVLNEQKEYSFRELQQREESVLGFNLEMNPLRQYAAYIKKHNLLKPSDITVDKEKEQLRVIGTLSSIREIKTKKGTKMAFATLEDSFSKLDCVLFTKEYQEYGPVLEKNNVYLLMVTVEKRNNSVQLIINKVHKMKP